LLHKTKLWQQMPNHQRDGGNPWKFDVLTQPEGRSRIAAMSSGLCPQPAPGEQTETASARVIQFLDRAEVLRKVLADTDRALRVLERESAVDDILRPRQQHLGDLDVLTDSIGKSLSQEGRARLVENLRRSSQWSADGRTVGFIELGDEQSFVSILTKLKSLGDLLMNIDRFDARLVDMHPTDDTLGTLGNALGCMSTYIECLEVLRHGSLLDRAGATT
jgi:hypothetical protein